MTDEQETIPGDKIWFDFGFQISSDFEFRILSDSEIFDSSFGRPDSKFVLEKINKAFGPLNSGKPQARPNKNILNQNAYIWVKNS